jgi:CRP-like cAMP-binding protein
MRVAPIPLPLERRHDPPRAGPVLAGLPGARPATVARGELLAGHGRPLARWAVVQAGFLAVSGSIGARRGLLGVLAPGDLAGAELISSDPPRPGPMERELYALTSTKLALLSPEEFLEAAARDPAVALAVAEASVRWAGRLERALARQLCLGVTGRVLEALREVADATGATGSPRRRIEVPLAQETLATMVGATRESVNRAIRALADAGLVRRDGRRYSVAAERSWTAVDRSP